MCPTSSGSNGSGQRYAQRRQDVANFNDEVESIRAERESGVIPSKGMPNATPSRFNYEGPSF